MAGRYSAGTAPPSLQPEVPQPDDNNPQINPDTTPNDPPAAKPQPPTPTVNNHRQALQGIPLNKSTPTVAPVNDMAANNAAYAGLMATMGGIRNGDLSGVPAGDIGYAGMINNDRYGTVFGDRIANDIAAQRGISIPSVSLGDVFSGSGSIPTFDPANAPILTIPSTYS
jgi:hypothetical protein